MSLSRLHRRFAAWLTMIAMVLGALAPAVAQAVVASSDQAQWVEVCSVSGMVWVKADASAQQADGQATSPLGDAGMKCPWCTLHGGAAGVPPVLAVADLLPRQAELPPAFIHVATLHGVWAVAHARAPPITT